MRDGFRLFVLMVSGVLGCGGGGEGESESEAEAEAEAEAESEAESESESESEPEICEEAATLACGDSIAGTNIGGQSKTDSNACGASKDVGPESFYRIVSNEAQVIAIDLTVNKKGQDLDLFVLRGSCDENKCAARSNRGNSQPESVVFTAEAGVEYIVFVDGYSGEFSPDSMGESEYEITVQCGAPCVDEDEDGNGAPDTETDFCPAQCDAGDRVVDCSTAMLDGDNGGGEGTDVAEDYTCLPDIGDTGPELAYAFSAVSNGSATATIQFSEEIALDLFVILEVGGLCFPESPCVGGATYGDGTKTVTFYTTAGQNYYIIVDGYDGSAGPFTLTMSCEEEVEVPCTDEDGDGYGAEATDTSACANEGEDCDDTSAGVNPGAEEVCNEVDDNCNGEVDEDGGPCDGTDDDFLEDGVLACIDGARTCTDDPDSVEEVCGNGIDDDGDGSVDEGC